MTVPNLAFVPYEPRDEAKLIAWLTGDTWEFHGNPRPTAEQVAARAAAGAYHSDQARTFWIRAAAEDVGVIRIFDLQDPTAVFDLRVRTTDRGRGVGTTALRWLTGHVFATYPHIIRIEGHTRQDNVGMRKVFRACAYIKEAHHRKCWPAGDTYLDAIGYGILRSDWENGTTTPVRWDDEP